MTAVEALQRCTLFRDFTETGLRIFASIAIEKTVPAGSPLFVENMVGESAFVVKSGTLRVTQKDGQAERELAVLGPGEALGAIALFGKTVRLVSAVAATPCEVLEITQRDFAQLTPQKPQACLKLALAIGADLASKADALRELAGRR